MNWFARLCVSVLACYSAGFLGSLFVSVSTGGWYDALTKPFFNPPNWLFAPVWFVLYACMAAALMLIWNKAYANEAAAGWVRLFFAHLLLNAAWTIFFFGFHAIFIALITILILIACIALLMLGAWEIDKRATYLLAPYLLWVLFATLLNASIWFLN